MTLKYYFSLLLSLLIGVTMSAQQVVVTELPTQKQLPVSNIHRIFQDSEGYMWYGTEGGGLCRDNGYQVDVFRSDLNTPGLLASNDITCITEDKLHRIWFGTKQGLYQLDKADYQITECNYEGLQGKRIDAILAVQDGTVWVSTQEYVFHYGTEGKKLGSYTSLWNNQPKGIADFFEDSRHQLWILQWGGGLLQYHPDKDCLTAALWECPAAPVQMIEDTVNQCYWIGTWGKGVVRYTSESGDSGFTKATETGKCLLQSATFADVPFAGKPQNIHKAQVIGLLRDSHQGILWVSAMNNLYAYRIVDRQLSSVSTGHFLSGNNKILDRIIEDHSGNIWVPGYSPHTFILSFDPNKIERFPVPAMTASTGYPVMTDCAIQEENYYWIWQGRIGLSLYHPSSNQISFASDFMNEIGNLRIGKCIRKCRSQQGIWAAGNGGKVLHIIHQGMEMKVMDKIELPDAGQISAIHEDSKGNLWIGTGNDLFQYQPSSRKLKKIQSNTLTIRGITTSSDGTVYYTTDSQKLVSIQPDGQMRILGSGENYSSIALAPDGTIWMATLQGNVYCYSPSSGKLSREINAGNPNGDAVKGIETDALGHIWVLADQYVKEYNPRNQSFRILHNSDRFIGVDYFLSIGRMEDGSICLGGIGAFCLIAPSAELDQSPSTILPVVSFFKIDRNSHIKGINLQRIELAADYSSLEIAFSTLEHLHAQRISYAYRLTGWDTDWNYLPTGTNTAYFSKLPKGNYTLEIKATDVHGRWGKSVSCLYINRLPAWYETWWAYTLYIIVAASFVFVLLKLYFNRIRNKQRERMEQELTQMKFRFFTNISHEFRTPLTLIMTPLSSLLDSIQEEKLKFQLSLIYRNAQELLQLVNQLLDFRKLEMGGEKLVLMNGEINEFVRSVCEAFMPVADNKQITFSFQPLEQSFYIYFDRNKLHRVIYNLLSNAFKFTPTDGRVDVSMQIVNREETRYLCICVKDSGEGIESNALARIFDRYYQVDTNRQATAGSGIGLHLVKEYITLHHGLVEVDSRINEGAEFRVFVPVNLNEGEKEDRLSTESVQTVTDNTNHRKTILLVEDNAEFLHFLYRQFSSDYHIYTASNGVEAEVIANEKDIDIIISDVMMPEMDGFELCNRIKQNIKTSHIFVILLTACAGDENKLEGYESGADCYLTKPFNMEILHNRIRHFIELQQKRKQLFLTGIEVNTENITSSRIDEEFLKKAIALVEKNLDNCDYSVELFSDDMCMSRMNLYRKLQSITGQKPTEFIRSIRLKAAARLLTTTDSSVLEISERVGFSTPSYFSKCFKEVFGVLPTQYHG